MAHSTLTSKGQTTIPRPVRAALGLKPGDRIEYTIESGHAVMRAHPGAMSLQGALPSNKGRGMTFAQIRAATAATAMGRR